MIKKICLSLILLAILPLNIILSIFRAIKEIFKITTLIFNGKSFLDSICIVAEKQIEETEENIDRIENILGR